MNDSDFSMFCLFFGNEELSIKEIKEECAKEKWVPLVCISEVDSDKKEIVCFYNSSVAMDFIRRNYKRKDCVGVVTVSVEDKAKIKSKGFELSFYEWPNKININKKVLTIEIFELGEEPHIVIM